jgi:uncharacterized Fe-S cluster-containing radical SAM superfamily protein
MEKPLKHRLEPGKFEDPEVTGKGERRAKVPLNALETLWFNTGSLCNLTCGNCFMESSPKNDRLVYLTRGDVAGYLEEIKREGMGTRLIGFTGGEPFMNPQFLPILETCLAGDFEVLVLTNAMRPMMKCAVPLAALGNRYGARLTIRVSLDHYGKALHEAERGLRTWAPTIKGLAWLAAEGFRIHVAGRHFGDEPEAELRNGFARLFATLGLEIDCQDPWQLVLFPEMDETLDVPEITEACWDILGVRPESVMCASSRMVVKRKGAAAPVVLPCTLLPYDPQFEMGRHLAEASGTVALNHPHCARFCVLGGAACSG